MFTKLDHPGIIVKDINAAAEKYCDIFHVDPSDIIKVDVDNMFSYLIPIGKQCIELMQMKGSAPRQRRYLEALRNQPDGLFHINVFTDDYDHEVRMLKEKGCQVEEDVVTEFFPGYLLRMAWIPPEFTGGVWIELVDQTALPPSIRDNN